ncbi:MAG: hypothetical protein ACRECL_07345, partial [Bradyrhizobium sp.]
VSILVFGLGAAALLRAAHQEFASNASWGLEPETLVARRSETVQPVLALFQVQPPAAKQATTEQKVNESKAVVVHATIPAALGPRPTPSAAAGSKTRAALIGHEPPPPSVSDAEASKSNGPGIAKTMPGHIDKIDREPAHSETADTHTAGPLPSTAPSDGAASARPKPMAGAPAANHTSTGDHSPAPANGHASPASATGVPAATASPVAVSKPPASPSSPPVAGAAESPAASPKAPSLTAAANPQAPAAQDARSPAAPKQQAKLEASADSAPSKITSPGALPVAAAKPKPDEATAAKPEAKQAEERPRAKQTAGAADGTASPAASAKASPVTSTAGQQGAAAHEQARSPAAPKPSKPRISAKSESRKAALPAGSSVAAAKPKPAKPSLDEAKRKLRA